MDNIPTAHRYTPGTVQNALYVLTYLTHPPTHTPKQTKTYEVGTSLHFYMRKSEHRREVMAFTQSHTGNKRQNQDASPGGLPPESPLHTWVIYYLPASGKKNK